MKYQNISSVVSSNICTITIERMSKMNALNIATLQEIKHAITAAENAPLIFGIILRGEGEKAFAAGADIAEFVNFSSKEAEKMSRDGHEVMNTIAACTKPVIAAVFGFALGGGCELAMACHFRVAAENAKFGQPEVSLGVPPGYGGTQRLVQLIGKARALEFLLTTEVIRAENALLWGLANKVVPIEEVIPTAVSMINKIATMSPDAVAKVVTCVNAYFNEQENGMELEIKSFSAAFSTQDFKRGTTAFINKIKADFRES